MCTDKDNEKNKTTKTRAPKFSDFQFVSIDCFVKNQVYCMSGLFFH